MSEMHNPAHPGEVLREWIGDVTVTQAAQDLKMSRTALSKILNARAGITAPMAIKLSAWLGTSPDVWLSMQVAWDLWQARKLHIPKIKPMTRQEVGA